MRQTFEIVVKRAETRRIIENLFDAGESVQYFDGRSGDWTIESIFLRNTLHR
jgi:hypothetical protein